MQNAFVSSQRCSVLIADSTAHSLLTVAHLVKEFLQFVEYEGSSPYSQNSISGTKWSRVWLSASCL
jgi:hypothetical protein